MIQILNLNVTALFLYKKTDLSYQAGHSLYFLNNGYNPDYLGQMLTLFFMEVKGYLR